jgi:Ca2+/H+ antiporter, TMEM165/GDT1 family
METRSRAHRIARIVTFALPAFLIVFALLVWAVSALWNGLMPEIFGLPTITYWQALGLMVLSWILFGGLRGRSGHGAWRYDMRRGWARMTPAEREEFVQRLRSRCGDAPPPEAPPEPGAKA